MSNLREACETLSKAAFTVWWVVSFSPEWREWTSPLSCPGKHCTHLFNQNNSQIIWAFSVFKIFWLSSEINHLVLFMMINCIHLGNTCNWRKKEKHTIWHTKLNLFKHTRTCMTIEKHSNKHAFYWTWHRSPKYTLSVSLIVYEWYRHKSKIQTRRCGTKGPQTITLYQTIRLVLWIICVTSILYDSIVLI